MNLKPNVNLKNIHPKLVTALVVCEWIYKTYGIELTLTSVNDSKHGKNSLHPCGQAADLRTWNLTTEQQREITKKIKEAVGSEFDVVLESDHIHIEYDPK